MKNIERSMTVGEVFTPLGIVGEMLELLPENVWEREKTFCDPACGDGNMLVCVVVRKLGKATPLQALSTTFGIDIMPDNVMLCRVRMLEAALGMQYSKDATDAGAGTAREQGMMYILYRLCGVTHATLLEHKFDSSNLDLVSFVNLSKEQVTNLDDQVLSEEKFLNDLQEFMKKKLGKTAAVARQECRTLCSKVGNLDLVRVLFTNIVRADTLRTWDAENWCSKELPKPAPKNCVEDNYWDQ